MFCLRMAAVEFSLKRIRSKKKSSANVVEIGDDADIVDNTNAGGSHGKLPEESVQFLADRLMDFIYSKYSINKWDDVEEICKASVIIFPSVELDRLFNFKKRCGLIYHKILYLKYRKTSTKTKNRAVEQGSTNDNPQSVPATDNNQSDDEVDELAYLIYFKSCIVNREIEILKIKLKQTIEMRRKMLNKKGIDIRKMFPFYFVEPNLLLSPRGNSLELIVSKFIVYSDNINDDPHNFIDSSNKFPYLIAIGPTKADIKCFYIPIDKQLILVPTGFKTFDKMFHMFFKLHFVFNVDYHSGLKIFLTFMEKYMKLMNRTSV